MASAASDLVSSYLTENAMWYPTEPDSEKRMTGVLDWWDAMRLKIDSKAK